MQCSDNRSIMKQGDIDGDANEDHAHVVQADAPLRKKRNRGSPASGENGVASKPLFIGFLIANGDYRHDVGFKRGALEDQDCMADWPLGSECMAGAVLFRCQHFIAPNIDDLPSECRQLCSDARDLIRGHVSGFIMNFAMEHAVVEQWHEVDSGAPIVRHAAGKVQWCEASHSADPRPPWKSFNDVLRQWQTDHRCAHFQTTSTRMHPYTACQTLEWQYAPIHAVALPLNHLPLRRSLLGDHPQQAARQASASLSAQGPATRAACWRVVGGGIH